MPKTPSNHTHRSIWPRKDYTWTLYDYCLKKALWVANSRHSTSSDGEVTPGEMAKFLVSEGANMQSEAELRCCPLAMATYNDLVDVVDVLLQGGATVDARDSWDATALHISAAKGHVRTAEQLLKKGADIQAVDHGGQTPLHWTVKCCSDEDAVAIVEFFLTNGAEIEARCNYGGTPLIKAAAAGKKEVVTLLLEKGAQIDSEDNHGSTALMWVIREAGNAEVVKILLERGARLDSEMFHAARCAECPEIWQLLEEYDRKRSAKTTS